MRPQPRAWRRLLAALLIVAVGGAAYANFVTNGATLPPTKRDLTPLPPGADPTRYIAAADYNALMNAILDVRTTLINGTFLGFALQATHPSVPTSGSLYNLWVKTSNTHLIYTANGSDTDLSTGGAASTLATVYSSGSSSADQTMSTVAGRPVTVKGGSASLGELFHVQDSGANDLLDINDIDRALISGAAANAGTNVGVRTNAKTALLSGRHYLAIANGGTDQWCYWEATGTNSTTPTLEACAGASSQIFGNGNLFVGASSAADSYVQVIAGGNAGVVSTSGNVVLSAGVAISLSSNVSVASGKDTAAVGGASDWDYSPSSGFWKGPTGAHTFAGSSYSVNAAWVGAFRGFSQVDNANANGVADGGGAFTVGRQLAFNLPVTITGVRVYWLGGAGAVTWKIQIWDSTNSSVCTVNLAVNAAGIYSGNCGSPVTVGASVLYKQYTIGGYQVAHYPYVATAVGRPGCVVSTGDCFSDNSYSPNAFVTYIEDVCYDAGDTRPTTRLHVSNQYIPIEPVFTAP